MKKIILVLLALFMLTGCGDSSSNTSEQSSSNITVEEKTKEDEQASEESTFEEIVVCDNEYLTFKITGIDPDNMWGYTLEVFIENKTDKDIMISLDGVSVNGYMCDPFWGTDVYAGKKANSEISWSDTQLEENKIENIEDIDFTLHVTDNNTWDTIYENQYTVTLN